MHTLPRQIVSSESIRSYSPGVARAVINEQFVEVGGGRERRWRGPLLVLASILVVFILLSAVIALKTPAWEANDEPGHVQNIEALVSGHWYGIPSHCYLIANGRDALQLRRLRASTATALLSSRRWLAKGAWPSPASSLSGAHQHRDFS